MNKTELRQFAKNHNVNIAYSGSTGTMFVSGEQKAVNGFVIKCNIMGKAKVPFTFVKQAVA